MTSSPRRIIRGAAVEGVLFCTPGGTNSHDPVANQEKENLQALEEFWQQKGIEEGKKAGFEEGFAAGQEEGYRKGQQEGEAKGREEGFQEGYEKGLTEGKESVVEELQSAIDQVETLATQLKSHQEQLFEEGKAELIAFSLRVCERIIRHKLQEPDFFKQAIQYAVQRAQPLIKECPVEVLLAPEDYEKMKSAGLKEELLGILAEHASSLRILPDEQLSQGDCRLETAFGLVNFDLKRLLADLEQKVLEVRSDETPAELPTPSVPKKAIEDVQPSEKEKQHASEFQK